MIDVEIDPVNLERLKLQQSLEMQLKSNEEKSTLVFFYNEAIIQYGFIILFSPVFVLAPLLSCLTNMLEIKIKLN